MSETTNWFHDPHRYTEWALNLRRLIILADNVLTAANQAGPDQKVSTQVDFGGDPKGVAQVMRVAANGLRQLADGLDTAAASGIEDGRITPILPRTSGQPS